MPFSGWIDLPENGGTGGVASLNGLSGALTLVAGSGITITPSGSDITISSTGGGGTPAGPNEAVQYNNSGAFGGNSGLLYDGANLFLAQIELLPAYTAEWWGSVSSFIGNISDEDQTYLAIQFGSTDTANPNNSTSAAILITGDLTATTITNANAYIGTAYVQAGNIFNDTSGLPIDGGAVLISAGQAVAGDGGPVNIYGGGSASGQPGNIYLQAGYSSGTETTGNVAIVGSTLQLSGTSGEFAQLLFSVNSLMASPTSGDFEFDGTYLYYTDNTDTRQQLAIVGENILPAPLEALASYFSNEIGQGSFIGNDSDEDQTYLSVMFGSTDEAIPSYSSSSVTLLSGDLTAPTLSPGVMPGLVTIQAGGVILDNSGNAIPGGNVQIFAGNSIDGQAGSIKIEAGLATTSGGGGNVDIIAGNSGTGIGGYVRIYGGTSTGVDGGIIINAPADVGSNPVYCGIGVNTPLTGFRLELGAGTESQAPLGIDYGTLLSTPQSGAIENDGTYLYYTDNTPTRRILLAGDATNVPYTVGDATKWAASPPTTVQQALDRIAAVVGGVTPIP